MCEIDYKELSGDEQFKERLNNFETSLKEIKTLVDTISSNDIYDDLTPEDKVRLDLFVAFTINSLYWLYLRTQGKDPSQTELKSELNRVKEYMAKSKKIYERKHVMPRLDKGAAGRFIRSGLWDLNEKQKQSAEQRTESTSTTTESSSKSLKRKREDDDEDI